MSALARFVRRHSRVLQESMAVGSVLCAAFAANFFFVPKWHFSWVGFIFALATVGLYLGRLFLSNDLPVSAKKAATKKFLNAAEKMLSLGKHKAEVHAYCHTVDREGNWLVPFCYGGDWRAEVDHKIPLEDKRFVIVDAFDSHGTKKRDLKDEERGNLSDVPIWDKMRCVLASPIRDFDDAACAPLGTLSLAGSRTLKELAWDTEQAARVCELLAAGIYELLRD
ncbi:MAG TPA: hypothetical protein VGX94_11835 [Terriglobia bacterium]|nr:hypothetical protein [Terriglobia bacterium]